MNKVSACPNCGGGDLFRSREISAGGGNAPNYLPGLGGFFGAEKFVVVVCRDCGLTRFFARRQAREKLRELRDDKKWTRVSAS
jgi:predicted nucleic-acid-binding Zn-ribbon protein